MCKSEEKKAPVAAAIGEELARKLNLQKKTNGLSLISFDFNKKKLSFHFLLVFVIFLLFFVFVLFCFVLL